MSINHEAASAQAELFAKNPQGYFTWESVNYGRAYLDLAAQLEAAHAKIEKYQRRLEITHCYDGHTGERKRYHQRSAILTQMASSAETRPSTYSRRSLRSNASA